MSGLSGLLRRPAAISLFAVCDLLAALTDTGVGSVVQLHLLAQPTAKNSLKPPGLVESPRHS